MTALTVLNAAFALFSLLLFVQMLVVAAMYVVVGRTEDYGKALYIAFFAAAAASINFGWFLWNVSH